MPDVLLERFAVRDLASDVKIYLLRFRAGLMFLRGRLCSRRAAKRGDRRESENCKSEQIPIMRP